MLTMVIIFILLVIFYKYFNYFEIIIDSKKGTKIVQRDPG